MKLTITRNEIKRGVIVEDVVIENTTLMENALFVSLSGFFLSN